MKLIERTWDNEINNSFAVFRSIKFQLSLVNAIASSCMRV